MFISMHHFMHELYEELTLLFDAQQEQYKYYRRSIKNRQYLRFINAVFVQHVCKYL